MENKFIKLKELDGDTFTVEAVTGHAYKSWDNVNRKMLTSPVPKTGHQKRWSLDTDKGKLEVSQNQMGKILEACFFDSANPVGVTFSVKSNGREVPDYYFNAVKMPVEDAELPFEDIPLE